ncbi:MAG: pyridoxamine 5'-phosphate oxidase family protein [Ferruginibacter sp.]
MLVQLNDLQINNILSSQVLGRLACTDGYTPYIVPVNYTYDGEYIYGQTNEGHKLEMLRRNPAVCFEVDIVSDLNHWQSVIIFGKFEELNSGDAQKARDTLFSRVYPMGTGSSIHPHCHEVTTNIVDRTQVKTVVYRIKLDKVTGRSEKAIN